MSEYIFENKDKKEFQDCTGDQMKQIVDGIKDGRVQFFGSDSNRWFKKPRNHDCGLSSIYRVYEPAPTPNVIDWPQVPAVYKYCYTHSEHGDILSERLPLELRQDDGLGYPGSGRYTYVNEYEYEFKRGTVESIDSLLIRPIGE